MITVTRDEVATLYRAAFDQVCDPQDWKAAVDCLVPWDLANLYLQAIEFMTGVKPDCEYKITAAGQMAHLTCVGYRAGPCGG